MDDDQELKYKNPAIIPLQSCETLSENLQNHQNAAVCLAPCHTNQNNSYKKRKI
jgi:hypothetical protein